MRVAERSLPNGRGALRLIQGGKRTEIQELAAELGLLLRARFDRVEAFDEMIEDHQGGW
jgi:hypothetical protein